MVSTDIIDRASLPNVREVGSMPKLGKEDRHHMITRGLRDTRDSPHAQVRGKDKLD